MTKKRLFFMVAVLLLTLVACTSLWAQATAQISGTVRDQSGAVLPGVEITATQTATGISRTTVTNETGSYVLPNVPVGPYRLEASLPGFRTFVQTGIVLQVNSAPVINPILEVGQVSEQIEVQANATLVETRTSSVGNVIENARILELPLNGRQVTELIALAGASTPTNVDRPSGSSPLFALGGANPFNRVGLSIAGGAVSSITFNLDGASHNNPANNLEMPMPFPDALQEFKVETSAQGAQSGTHSAGSVNAVTKGGTNELHGNLFEFVRNYKFNARNAFALRRDSLKRNQFGGTLGGPVVRSKVFFFGGYQGTIVRQDPSANINFVPSAAMLAGDFTAAASPACNVGRQVTLAAPFVNNRIDPSQFSPAALRIARALPATTDPCGRLVWAARTTEDGHQMIGRIDYQRSGQHTIFGRYMATTIDLPSPYELSGVLLNVAESTEGLAQAFTLGDTFVFSSNTVNSFRFAANRNAATRREPAGFFSLADIGVNMYPHGQKSLNVVVSNAFTIGANTQSNGVTKNGVFGINNDVSMLRGNHQLAFGASVARNEYNYWSHSWSRGQANFNGQRTGLSLADFLTGLTFTYIQAPLNALPATQWNLGLYAADTWKLHPRLTLNAGLRWEPYIPPDRKDGGVAHFDMDAFTKGQRTAQFRNAPPGMFYPGDPGFPGTVGMNKQWNNFSPRVGLAWDPNGDGRTSVRASYGLFYDFVPIQFYTAFAIAPPWDPRIIVQNGAFDDPWRTFAGGNPFPMTIDANVRFPSFSTYGTMNYDTKNPTVSTWNLSVQRQFAGSWLSSATYLGNNSIHLWTERSINPPLFLGTGPCTLAGVSYPVCSTTGNTNQRRLLSLTDPVASLPIGFLNLIDDGGTASYHGLLLAIQRLPSRGVSLNANYTWSHCISDPFQPFFGGSGSQGYTNPANRRFDRGNCGTSAADRRHTLNLTAVAETPAFSNPTLRALAGGWRFAPLLRIQSGAYMSITTTSDIALNAMSAQRVNQVLANPYGDKTVERYLNPAAFALPATGALGSSGAFSVAGPGYWQFDAAISRLFQVREGHRIEVRAEAFNVTNSLRMRNPVTVLNAGNFGQVTAAYDPRIMQFALKYVF